MMALSDSMFLFEIVVEKLESFMRCQEFSIKSQFTDVFTLSLTKPNGNNRQKGRKLSKRKSKVRSTATSIQSKSSKMKLQTGQTVLLANSIEWFITHMNKSPLEISLWSKKYPQKRLGGTCIPWSNKYLVYLNKLKTTQDLQPIKVNGKYDIRNKSTSKRVASITLTVKLIHLKCTDNLQSIKTLNNSSKNDFKENVGAIYDNEVSIEVSQIMEGGPLTTCNIERTYNLHRIVKSDTEIHKNSAITILRSKSLSLLHRDKRKNPLIYIFGCPTSQFGNRIYCVSYFTVENEVSGVEAPKEVDQPKGRYHVKLCDSNCPEKTEEMGCPSVCSLHLPQEDGHLVNITECKDVKCDFKKQREPTSSPDERILLDFSNIKTECCQFKNVAEKIEEVVGGVAGKIKIGDDPCFCSCECTFGFTKKTTYCGVCGGYEVVGEELIPNSQNEMPFPCPIFHKLIDKNKLKNLSTSGSESKKKGDDSSIRNMKASSGLKTVGTTKSQKSVESEKDIIKGKKKKDDRFKFNYGYKGIPPQIGHSECTMPCTGTLGAVPKNMGWLWTAEDIPGMKFRPMWKPGAVNKHVVRLLKIAKNPGKLIGKKRRKDTGKKKRPLKRPLLIVHKRDGEYTVTMETMKTYAKSRILCQHPYEDKPVVTYTIGRTDEENRDRRKKKERQQRRLERAQRQFIQSAFRDMCQDICLKTYQQALGILPGAEDPECTCFTGQSKEANVDVSCSCSEESSSNGSDTDLDEWIVEFTPPVASFDPTYKPKKLFKADVATQYTYLDYRVKILDRFGNPVPRFFKGPDGKQQCSDLGGFWSPDHKWLEINIDGYVAPDGRWAPNIFIGPNGENVDAEVGKFQATNGKWLVVGVDGYVDSTGKWCYYQRRGLSMTKQHVVKGRTLNKQVPKTANIPSQASWSCFGDVSPHDLSRMGIVGHGQDKKILLSRLRDMIAHGEDVKIPQPSTVYHLPETKKSKKARFTQHYIKSYLNERVKCHHPVPSEKGIVATDAQGNKTYFRLKDVKNKRPKERLEHLAKRGISLSSFHVPCFNSFVNSEIMKKEQRQRLLALARKHAGTQVG